MELGKKDNKMITDTIIQAILIGELSGVENPISPGTMKSLKEKYKSLTNYSDVELRLTIMQLLGYVEPVTTDTAKHPEQVFLCTYVQETGRISTPDMYNTYANWSDINGYPKATAREFAFEFKKHFKTEIFKSSGKGIWKGFSLNEKGEFFRPKEEVIDNG